MTGTPAAALPPCFVLTAGLGTRLKPLTDLVPKPLLWVGDRPQVEHVFAHLAASGVRDVVINTHHLADRFSDAWAARQVVRVSKVFEEHILGTGGALANAAHALGGGDVLLWNGDMLGSPDLRALASHHASTGAAATLLVGPPSGRGTLGLDAAGDVARIRTWSSQGEIVTADYLGIAIVSKRLRDRLHAPGCLVEDGFIPSLAAGDSIATVRASAPVVDIGSLASLLEANLAWLDARGAGLGVHVDASVAPDVRVERSIVGPGAVVRGPGVLRDALVLPGASLSLGGRTASRCIVGEHEHRV